MKLRNKWTGEIMDDVQYRNYSLSDGFGFRMNGKEWEYHSLAELNADWEDAPEESPKTNWYRINNWGEVEEIYYNECSTEYVNANKAIGNYFETKEEAERAVEKLKALKRLKDKGFRFKNDSLDICCHTINFKIDTQFDMTDETSRDLHLLFGGEE